MRGHHARRGGRVQRQGPPHQRPEGPRRRPHRPGAQRLLLPQDEARLLVHEDALPESRMRSYNLPLKNVIFFLETCVVRFRLDLKYVVGFLHFAEYEVFYIYFSVL